MPTVESIMERVEPVGPDALGSDVYRRFEASSDLLAIPVVEDGRPVGLIERDSFLVKLAGPLGPALYINRAVSHVMDIEPVTVEAGLEVSGFCDSLLKGSAASLLRGFIVTRDGLYAGVGAGVALLQATYDAQARQAALLQEQARTLNDGRLHALEAAHSRSRFLSIMSHELRAPVNGMLAVADLLRRQPLSPQGQGHLSTIVESSETLLRILDDTLDLSRAEAGELELNIKAASLPALMDDIQTTWAATAGRESISLLIAYEGDTELAVEIDAARLKQVFNNLIGNAFKFARGGVVEAGLKAVAVGDTVRLEARVRDDGPGVEADNIDTIFEPFVHGSGPDGAGLGLAVSRQIIDRMNGRIWAENNIGCGATFAFDVTVPRALVEAEPVSNISSLPELDLDRAPHILIVDDNTTNRVVAQALCEMFGCTSETAEDGVEAVDAVRERGFDAVLMDIKMPRMDGLQATLAIRQLEGPGARVPIIALTANADPDDARRYLDAGMISVVEKPIKPERLRLAINTALEVAAAAQAAEDLPIAVRDVA